MVGVDVHAETLVPTEVEELLRLEHGFLAVSTGEGGHVELEDDAELVEMAVVLHVHVLVALGVGEDGGVAALTDALERGGGGGRRPRGAARRGGPSCSRRRG